MTKQAVGNLDTVLKEANDLITQGEWTQAIKLLDPLLDKYTEDPVLMNAIVRGYLLRGFCHSELSEMTLSQKDYDKALEHSLTLKDKTLQAQSHARLANILWKTAKRELALKHIDQAKTIADRTKDPFLEGLVGLERATIHMLSEKPEIIEKEYRSAILALERSGDLRELSRAYNNFATNFLYRADFVKAAELFDKARKIAQRANYAPMVAWGSFNRGGCLSELGRFDEALAELDVAVPILHKTNDVFGLQGAQEIYGIIYSKKKDWSKAEEHFLIARGLAQKCKMQFGEAKTLYNMGRMYKWRGDKARAMRFFKEAKEMFTKLEARSDAEIAEKEMKELG